MLLLVVHPPPVPVVVKAVLVPIHVAFVPVILKAVGLAFTVILLVELAEQP